MPLPHLRRSGNCDFSTQSLLFPQGFCMLVLQLATSELLPKLPRTPLSPAFLSVDQCNAFVGLVATALALFNPDFTSKCHRALRPRPVVAFWAPPQLGPPVQAFAASLLVPLTRGHSSGSQTASHHWLSPTGKKKIRVGKELLWQNHY